MFCVHYFYCTCTETYRRIHMWQAPDLWLGFCLQPIHVVRPLLICLLSLLSFYYFSFPFVLFFFFFFGKYSHNLQIAALQQDLAHTNIWIEFPQCFLFLGDETKYLLLRWQSTFYELLSLVPFIHLLPYYCPIVCVTIIPRQGSHQLSNTKHL